MVRRWMVMGLVVTGMAWGQQAEVNALLSKTVHYAERYRRTLPSLVCEEHIVSQELKKGKVKDEVDVEGTFRVTRTGPPDNPYEEAHDFRTVNGKRAPKNFDMPYFLYGAFADGLGLEADSLPCYTYTEEAGATEGEVVLVSTRKPGAEKLEAGCARTPPGSVRRTVIDRATGNVLRTEVRTPAESSKRMRTPYFAEIDYAPVALGDETVWLPVRVTTHDEKDDGRFEVRYTDFHRYGGGMKILPGVEKVPDVPGAGPEKPGAGPVR